MCGTSVSYMASTSVRSSSPWPPTLLSGEFDQKGSRATHWGTKDELILLIKTARELGMVSYVDGVLNHKMGADRLETFKVTAVDADDRSKDISGLFDIEV